MADSTQKSLDVKMMRRCLDLAIKAEGRTSPNPLVGAVVLDSEGRIAGEGYHKKAGEAHAEVDALAQAGQKARGATLYVNLEPCSHFGRTPPCANKVVEAGITRVVIGMKDPNPKVCGKGIEILEAAGIAVEFSGLEAECQELNRVFFKYIKSGLPWLTLKMAVTLDGRIADRFGKSRWISGPESRHFVHQLRNLNDCVLIGGSTAVIDDPELNVRELENGRDPVRVVIDPSLQVSPQARLCKHNEKSDSFTLIFAAKDRIENAPAYPEKVQLEELPFQDYDSSERKPLLKEVLRDLAQRELTSVLCEGGGRLAAALLSENLVDELCWIIAPKLFCDGLAIPSLAGLKSIPVDSCFKLESFSYTQLGSDMLLRGRLAPREQ